MKRLPALLALAVVLTAGTAGMASALTLDFNSPPSTPPYPQIAAITGMVWDGTGYYDGHLYAVGSWHDSTITFASPAYVNSFVVNGWPSMDFYSPDVTFGPLNIEALNSSGALVWSITINDIDEHQDLTADSSWLTVVVNTANVASLVLKAPNPNGIYGDANNFYPSIDNLMINEAATVPIPASIWLLASGLLGLAGLRRKLSR
jgi:hypothetical protein